MRSVVLLTGFLLSTPGAAAAIEVYETREAFASVVGTAPILSESFNTPPALSLVVKSNRVTVQWNGLGTLEEAWSADGPWTRSFDQRNPQTFDLPSRFHFYRIVSDLRGVAVLPGVYISSPFANLGPFPDGDGFAVFGSDSGTRRTGLAYYEINFKTNYNALAFDVDAWDPSASGPALVEVQFADSTAATLQVFQRSHSEDVPVFFGIVADRFIKRLRWNETPEIRGGGNEEVALDELAVANTLGALE